ncbi:MAG: hypothetical protein JXO22_00160 [Phycisphaerae bacterium]|nr:hypothetical protein [Phycisphaerae bacterium]
MHTWKSHLRSVLFRLARTHGNNSIADIERLLCEIFDASAARFVTLEDQALDPGLQLQDVLQKPFTISLRVEYQPHHTAMFTDMQQAPEPPAASVAESRFQPESSLSPEERVGWFIREFDRLEQTHDFMWAGYIVKEMMGRIGLSPPEARTLLDELNAAGIVSVSKVPNPKNPEHPASAVRLIRENDQVQAILGPPTGEKVSAGVSDQPAEEANT